MKTYSYLQILIVCLGLKSVQLANESSTSPARNNVGVELSNKLSEVMIKKDTKSVETARNALMQQAVKEQVEFDTAKNDLRIKRNRYAQVQKNVSHTIGSIDGQAGTIFDREESKTVDGLGSSSATLKDLAPSKVTAPTTMPETDQTTSSPAATTIPVHAMSETELAYSEIAAPTAPKKDQTLISHLGTSVPEEQGEMRAAPHQSFRVKPRDVHVKEGDDVTLTCEIDHLAGMVQWTKDGMALGVAEEYNTELWGYPRYKYVGNKNRGICNLQIRNVSLDDDAEYQCQVSQKVVSPGNTVPQIRAAANLTVILPPSSIEIVGHESNSRVDVGEREDLILNCLLHNSRPHVEIFWYRGGGGGGEEIKADRNVKYADCKTLHKSRAVQVCNALSTITLRPELVDDGQEYSCVARQDALPGEFELSTRVYLQILHAPGQPYIDGYREGYPADMKSVGQVLELMCRSSGGKPLPQLRWFKNGVELSKEILISVQGKVSENRLRIELRADDNNANYTCEASNAATRREPLRVTTRLSVAYGPDSVDISELGDATAGEVVSLTCATSSSNPPAEIQWVVEDQSASNNTATRTTGEDGGTITTSTLNVVVPFNRKEMLVSCYASNPKFSKYLHATRTVNIHYPPGPPIIRGYSKTSIGADSKHELSCTATGGNPLAELTWYKNGREIRAVNRSSDRTSSFADITIVASKSDNGAEYKCEATNPSLSEPLATSVQLQVYFAPENASVIVEPSVLHVGTLARLFCTSGSSNPAAEITWWRNNRFQITDGISTYRSEPDSYGGRQSNSELLLNVTTDMHQDTFTCRATNTELQKSINFVTRRLEVLFKPIFKRQNYSSLYSAPKNSDFSVTLEADANPSSISYFWKRGDTPVDEAYGPTLRLRSLEQWHAGTYTCEARNSEGSDFLSFKLDVTYEASITSIARVVTVQNGTDAEMRCTVSGNPLEREDVWWTNQEVRDFNHRAVTSFENKTLTLKFSKATLEDMGRFYCIVNNRIGVERNASTLLLVEHAPVTQRKTEALTKVASDSNQQGRFVCEGSGVPRLDFTWFKNGSQINRTVKYSIENQQLNETNHKSTLLIKQIAPSDYDYYYCVMRNKLGSLKLAYKLITNSKPDPPSGINVLNITYDTISLAWMLPFDGGEPTTFRIRYFAEDKPTEKRSLDVGSGTSTTITGLRPGAQYTLDLQSVNVYGGSDYSTVKVNTTAPTTVPDDRLVERPVDVEGTILLLAAIGGSVLLLLNLLVIFYCAWRRVKKAKKSVSDPGDKSLEMYTTASKNGTTDISSGTLSSVHSLKFNHEDNVGALNFIIEDINYPFIEKNDPDLTLGTEPKYKLSNEAYSSVGHLHLVPSPVAQLDFCYDTGSVIGQPVRTLTLPSRGRMSQDYSSHTNTMNCLPNGSSPTPSIPPPMSAISTHAYSSLQYMHKNYLHV